MEHMCSRAVCEYVRGHVRCYPTPFLLVFVTVLYRQYTVTVCVSIMGLQGMATDAAVVGVSCESSR